MKVIVIGGGASGLVASITSATKNEVILLEKNNKCGKKLLITGNGKCNYWNSDFKIDYFNSQNMNLLKHIITLKNQEKVLSLLDKIGIVPKIRNGYYYPASSQAISVKEALVKEAKIRGVNIITNCNVLDIIKKDKYIIKTNMGEFSCDKVILATGSLACGKTGSTGDGYKFLKKLGHNIIKPLPALVKLVGDESYFNKWKGIRCDVNLKLYEEEKLIIESSGEIQLTSYGISGICVFQLSGVVARGLYNHKKEVIAINFLPNINNFISYMNNRNDIVKNRSVSELMDQLINYNLVNLFLNLSDINNEEKWDSIDLKRKNKLERLVTSFPLKIINTKGYDDAQVCTGGISLSEVNINTLESKYNKNLYIAGELLDCDGVCGGYNLGFAFISGLIAGENYDIN